MTVRKFLLSIFLVLYLVGFSQEKTKYPKDTIYVKYDKERDNKIVDWIYKNDKGVYFSIKNSSRKSISVFTSYKSKFDTLNVQYLKKIEFLDLKKIEKFESIYYKNRFGRNPWIKNKNAVFVTYVIEQINEDCIVKYPVVWRNEGVTD